MCLLSVYSPQALVNVEHLETGADDNRDGYGFAVIVGDRIETGHGMNADAMIEAFDAVRTAHPESWAMFHSRYTTDGPTTPDNCQPFLVGGDERTVLAHNGILPKQARPGPKDHRSDSRILAEAMIPQRMFGRLHRERGRKNLEKWMGIEGYPNKIAILTVDPRYKGNAFILAEDLGEWVDGVWHSNGAYKPWRAFRPSTVGGLKDPWGAYMAGAISYSEYIDLKYGITKPATVACWLCEKTSCVDQVYMFCRDCKICLDCYDSIEVCTCWVPASQRTDERDPSDGEDGELSPVAVEAALAGLPADQANRVREALSETGTLT